MTPPRFFLPPESIIPPVVAFLPERCAQIANVLRLKAGDAVHVIGQGGEEYHVLLTSVNRKEVLGRIESSVFPGTEPVVHLELWVCTSRREKVEWIIQKCTEIGASSFRFLVSERSLVQSLADIESKIPRWQQIAMEAAEQSGRVKIPELLPPLALKQAVALPDDQDTLKCIAWELDQEHTIRELAGQIGKPSRIILLTGPEGGFSESEVQLAVQYGFQQITLGKRIYRLETAAMVGCVLLLDAFKSL
ncbi:MAG: 16S rRNA (uracil(1498)-N(3))-methyltransferase [bacterium]